MYELIFIKSAEADFDSLDRALQNRVVEVLERIKINPRRYLKKLVGTDYYRLRVGDYRVIIHIDEPKKRLVILRIGHRKNVYL
ncbi:type II toxin-antitoxin system RelE/ParE family toxin [Candidatus Micrarchaeota archaeon]|nr:type II toxin-antitoxin system RelE/ParE family toxin [Candidatus Micrarchaeota archaeon]